MFRKLELGTLVGKRTWGGLVGILGFPTILDGGAITAPNLAFWTEEGVGVENEGVPPDVEIEQAPADVIAGHDPQLEKAIGIASLEMEAEEAGQAGNSAEGRALRGAPRWLSRSLCEMARARRYPSRRRLSPRTRESASRRCFPLASGSGASEVLVSREPDGATVICRCFHDG